MADDTGTDWAAEAEWHERQACPAGLPWTGDDPSSDHGHTDCLHHHTAAVGLRRLAQLDTAIGDPDELRWHRWHCEETGQGDDLRELLVRIADAADAAVAEGAEHAETAQRQMKGDPTSKTSDEINAQRDAGWPDFHPEDYCHRCGRPNGNWFIDLGEPEWYAITSGIGIVCPSCFMALDGDGLIYELRRWTPSAGPAAAVAEAAEDRGQTDG